MAARRVKMFVGAPNDEGSYGEEMEVADVSPQNEHDHGASTHDSVNVFEYAADNVLEEVGIEVANDSGSVAHVLSPDDTPFDVIVVKPPNGKCRKFIGAGGDGIKNHGRAEVEMIQVR